MIRVTEKVSAFLVCLVCLATLLPPAVDAQEKQEGQGKQEQPLNQKPPERSIEICKRHPVGAQPPDLKTSQDAANALRKKVNFTPWWIYRNTLAGIFTPLKHAGFRGWTDYCAEACAVGKVLSGVGGVDAMYTVDMALESFSVNGVETHLDGPRFVRVEFFSETKKSVDRLPRKGDSARICGKLMWDGDGFLEIHPRESGGVEILNEKPKPGETPAAPAKP
jgi:hypothetical protein